MPELAKNDGAALAEGSPIASALERSDEMVRSGTEFTATDMLALIACVWPSTGG